MNWEERVKKDTSFRHQVETVSEQSDIPVLNEESSQDTSI